MKNAKDSAIHAGPGSAVQDPPPIERPRVSNRRALNYQQYMDGILSGQRTILAQALTLIESSNEADRELAEQIVESCLPHSGNSLRIGITGVPGAGKSTFIDALGAHVIQQHQRKIAVLAIDPSSQISGGSILGDKTRMTTLAVEEMAFIRPSPSRGSFGGIAQHTREAMLLCEAAGYEAIIVETVGVGQSETAVREMVDFFLLIALAGAGDELQGIKRGVMELASIVAINKADGENLDAAERARADAQLALHFFPESPSGWAPRALTCSALTGRGIPEIWNCILQHNATTKANGWFARARREQARSWMHEIVQQGLMQRFLSNPAVQGRMKELEERVSDGLSTSFHAARELLEAYSSGSTERKNPTTHGDG
jgi:LAO/AO transport system kinase